MKTIPVLEVKNLDISIQKKMFGKNKYQVLLTNVSFKVYQGEIVLLHGNNGSGKTTLVKALLDHEVGKKNILDFIFANNIYINIVSGEVKVDGKNIYNLDREKRQETKRIKVSSLEQLNDNDYYNNSTGEECVKDQFNKLFERKLNIEENAKLKELFARFDPINGSLLKNKKIREMSGGEKRTVSIIATLFKEAEIYIFDEPINNLDYDRAETFSKIISEMKKRGKAIVIITHCLMHMNPDRIYSIRNNSLEPIEDIDLFFKKCIICNHQRETREKE